MKTKSLTFATLLMCLSVTAQVTEQYCDLNNTVWHFIELTNYDCSAARITEVAGNIPSDIVIPADVSTGEDNYLVTEIGEHVFSGRVIETISIPSSVCVIGYNAFYGCSTMWAVKTPSMEDWCKLWFNGYYSNPIRYATYLHVNGKAVRDVVIPESVTTLHSYAFAGYSELRTVTFHEQLTGIGQYAFEDCKNMTFEKLPDSLTFIGQSAFHGCKALTSIIIPKGVVSIGANCFTGCTALTSVVIPSSLNTIGSFAFSGCNNLSSVTLMAKTPLSLSEGVFSNSADATLFVPSGCKAAYEAADYWKDFKEIVEINNTPSLGKCATPTISFAGGELEFTCETEGVEFEYEVTVADAKKDKGNKVSLTGVYQVSVYATKEGYENSDVATLEFTMSDTGLKGDVNGDGVVDVSDYIGVANLILFGTIDGK